MKALGYCRVSTDEQARSGLGVEAQVAVIRAEAERRGWELVEIITDDGYSGWNLNRPGITRALELLRTGKAGALIASDLDRIARKLTLGSAVMEAAKRERWAIVAVGFNIDTSTADGEMAAHMKLTVAHWERQKIAERTRAALAAKKARGVRLGRPVLLPATTRRRIARMRAAGASLRVIAAKLNADKVPTAHGASRWHAETVAGVLRSLDLDAA